jgi:hypothetical protein
LDGEYYQTQKKQFIMNIQKIWKEVKSFNKKANSNHFSTLLSQLGYKELSYKSFANKGIITRRKFLVLSPANKIEIIVLGKTNNIISITSK